MANWFLDDNTGHIEDAGEGTFPALIDDLDPSEAAAFLQNPKIQGVNSALFFTGTTEFKEVNTTSPQVVGSTNFVGTDIVTPDRFEVIASRNGLVNGGTIELFDFTNGNSIATIAVTNETKITLVTISLSNLPALEAIFELRLSKDTAAASKLRIHYYKLV